MVLTIVSQADAVIHETWSFDGVSRIELFLRGGSDVLGATASPVPVIANLDGLLNTI